MSNKFFASFAAAALTVFACAQSIPDGTPVMLKFDQALSSKTAKKGDGNCAEGVEMERESMLCWVERLKKKEQAVVADCRSLKSQACWDNANVVDAYLDALVMDSEKHQRLLLAVEKAIENIIMSRPQ